MPVTARLQLYRKQVEFVKSSAPTVTFQGGAGSGKTRAGCAKALLCALQAPGSRGMIVGPSYPGLKQAILPHLEAVGDELQLRRTWQYNRADQQIILANGATLWLRSADNPESLLGADLAWLWGDEPALWKHDAYRYVVGRLRQPGFRHQAFFTFTPKGRNWAASELCTAREGLEIIRVSSLDNPFVGEDFRERLRREYGEGSQWWRQEVLGEVVSFEGLIYPMFDPEQHVMNPPEGTRFVRHVIGCDWGWANPGVLLAVGLDTNDRTWSQEEVVATERPLEWWISEARRLVNKWGADAILCDPSEPGNIDAFRRAGLPARAADNAVIPGIAAVSARVNSGRERVSPECVNEVREYLSYSWKQTRDGSLRPDEPLKVDDHVMDARRYAEMELIGRPAVATSRPVFVPRG